MMQKVPSFNPIFIVIFLSVLFYVPPVTDNDSACASTARGDQGQRYGNPRSLEVRFINTCSNAKDFRLCIETRGEKWNCKMFQKVKPKEPKSFCECSSSGRWQLDDRDPSSEPWARINEQNEYRENTKDGCQ